MTAEEITRNENESFLEWRRTIATVQEGAKSLAITPFEKNVNVWRQLWRVIEKADLLLQIVDARNPYFFYSADLEKYIDEQKQAGKDKEFLLVINKSDFLSEDLIKHWNEYFLEKKVNHIFFSALEQQAILDSEVVEEYESDGESSNEDPENDPFGEQKVEKSDMLTQIEREEKEEAFKEKQAQEKQAELAKEMAGSLEFNTTKMFNRLQLLSLLKKKVIEVIKKPQE